MSKLSSPRYCLIIPCCFLFILGVLHCSVHASAASLVSGRYVSTSGTNIVLSLSIQSPSPSNLIVEQYLSPENNILSTSPRAKKVTAAKGKCKWLFRNISSGNITLSIKLKAPIKGGVRAMIRYRNPSDGKFIELQI